MTWTRSALCRATLAAVLFATSARADAPAPVYPAAAPQAEAVQPSDPGYASWQGRRLANAKKKVLELLRFPFVHRGGGWGCDCPYEFLAADGDSGGNGGGTAVKVEYEAGLVAPLPTNDDEHRAFRAIAEGWFTGQNVTETFDEHKKTLYGLHIVRWRYIRDRGPDDQSPDSSPDTLARVLRRGPDAHRVPPRPDARGWIVLTADFEASEKKNPARATAEQAKLVKAGFTEAAVLDSEQTQRFLTGYYLVVAGRFATKDAAETLLQAVRKAGYKSATVRQAW